MRDHTGRRTFLAASALTLASCSREQNRSEETSQMPPAPVQNSAVTVLKASSYEGELFSLLEQGIVAAWPEVRLNVLDKHVLLKPNLVEFDSNTCINTDPRVVLAAREVFLKFGARQVTIAEGPGHRRDTWDLADQAGYRKWFAGFDEAFVDLNLDDVRSLRAFDNEMDLFLPKHVLDVDLVVSLAKMKTHHWAGATLSMKNFFGIVPSAIYGWPKNLLHYQGIDRSIVELNRLVRHTFAIVDGIVAMEGNGPIQGTPVKAGVLVMGRDLPAVDATCSRLMGLDPTKMTYLQDAAIKRLGVIEAKYIDQRGETLSGLSRNFAVLPQFDHLRLPS